MDSKIFRNLLSKSVLLRNKWDLNLIDEMFFLFENFVLISKVDFLGPTIYLGPKDSQFKIVTGTENVTFTPVEFDSAVNEKLKQVDRLYNFYLKPCCDFGGELYLGYCFVYDFWYYITSFDDDTNSSEHTHHENSVSIHNCPWCGTPLPSLNNQPSQIPFRSNRFETLSERF